MISVPKKILYADDDMDDRELIEEALYQVDKDLIRVGAASGTEALELLESPVTENLSLILLDFNMPDLTGAQICEKISPMPRYRNIPRIIWSTSSSSLYRHISEISGATHYFQKPDTFDKIVELMRYILSLG
ncbi:MAG: response regulator [Puia sp.]|nr:response regulator [Puia sp.]